LKACQQLITWALKNLSRALVECDRFARAERDQFGLDRFITRVFDRQSERVGRRGLRCVVTTTFALRGNEL
jgi:hypothetical protein